MKVKKIKLPEWARDMPEELLEELWGVVRASKKIFTRTKLVLVVG